MEHPTDKELIETYLKTIGYNKPKVKKQKSNIFSGLITVYLQHETVKVL